MKTSTTGLAAILLVAMLSGCAGDYTTLVDLLDANDRQQIVNTTQQALEGGKTGEAINWANPASGHRGSVTPTRTYNASSGAPCREFQQVVTVLGRTRIAYDAACRDKDGSWNSVFYDSLTGALTDPWADYHRHELYYGYGYPYSRYGYRYGYPYDWPYYGHPYYRRPYYPY